MQGYYEKVTTQPYRGLHRGQFSAAVIALPPIAQDFIQLTRSAAIADHQPVCPECERVTHNDDAQPGGIVTLASYQNHLNALLA
jgi:hypothetical protein